MRYCFLEFEEQLGVQNSAMQPQSTETAKVADALQSPRNDGLILLDRAGSFECSALSKSRPAYVLTLA